MPASPTATAEHIRDVNERYHDVAAADYDAKWGIDFTDVGRDQTRQKLVKALGEWPAEPFGHALEIGAGTGYFSLNLMQQGAFARLTATDISSGMLDALAGTAADLGLAARVDMVRTGAERLPFEDESFDLVLGHAILHHIPDLDRAFAEFMRVLRPGGAIVFCGEPSRYGDRLAAVPKRLGALTAPVWRRLVGASALNGTAAGADTGHDLETEVDVHAFAPGDLGRALDAVGYEAIRVRGEELLANVYGWWLRSLESSAVPEEVPDGWRLFAFRSYIALQRADVALLEPRLPPSLFYNLILSARKPGDSAESRLERALAD
jgi:ubiquinone/menaquinone biosynthesis C-methylase UbiE